MQARKGYQSVFIVFMHSVHHRSTTGQHTHGKACQRHDPALVPSPGMDILLPRRQVRANHDDLHFNEKIQQLMLSHPLVTGPSGGITPTLLAPGATLMRCTLCWNTIRAQPSWTSGVTRGWSTPSGASHPRGIRYAPCKTIYDALQQQPMAHTYILLLEWLDIDIQRSQLIKE